jgi:hypothetical protein
VIRIHSVSWTVALELATLQSGWLVDYRNRPDCTDNFRIAQDRTIDFSDTTNKGFSLLMLKVVLDGRADELIDLAKVNLLR